MQLPHLFKSIWLKYQIYSISQLFKKSINYVIYFGMLVDESARAHALTERCTAAGVMFVQIVLQGVPSSTHSHHHMIP